MRRLMPKRSIWRVMQFDTLRLRLIKLATRVIELKTQIKIHLPSSGEDDSGGNPGETELFPSIKGGVANFGGFAGVLAGRRWE